MNKTHYIAIICALMCVLAGCKKKTTEEVIYSEAIVTSLSFVSDKANPGLSEAKFTILTAADTGTIYNQDSLRFGTSLDHVRPIISFNHTPSYAVFYTDSNGVKDTVIYTGSDTIHFNARPTRLLVMASDNKTAKWYNIFVNVHQIDPELYRWEQTHAGLFTLDGADSKAVQLNGQFCLLVNNGYSNVLYTSADAVNWSGETPVSGLPGNCHVSSILESEDVLYYADGDKLYTSTNGSSWTATDYSSKPFTLVNMLYHFNDSVWAITRRTSDGALQLACMATGGTLQVQGDTLPENFPISDFAACEFASASNRRRAAIIGGFNQKGECLNTRWNVEFLSGHGYKMVDFSLEHPDFEPLSGASLIWYSNKLQLIGGVNANNDLRPDVLISDDEGVNWSRPDTAKYVLPKSFKSRQKASVLVDDQHYIYIIGGQSRTETFADVYRGRLNKMLFKKQD